MTIKKQAIKNPQDKEARAEIAARRVLVDEPSASKQEKNTPSGSLEESHIDTDDIDKPQTTRAQAKA